MTIGVPEIVLLLLILLLPIWLYGRILSKAGYSRWWVAVIFVPFVNLIMVWVFAFAEWPAIRRIRA